MEWNLEFEPAAVVNLERLTKTVRDRVARKIRWLAVNLEQIVPEPLVADLSGYFKLRVGDYRIIYSIREVDKTIVIDKIGHRREIYN